VLFLNLPALVLAVLLYVWLGLTEAAAIGAVTLSKLPTVVVTLREGARALDGELAAMAKSFRLSAWRTLRHVTLPQLSPFFVIASRTGLALIWKIVLVVELLGRPDGIGYAIQVFFQLFDVKRLIAYSLAFVAVVLVIEWASCSLRTSADEMAPVTVGISLTFRRSVTRAPSRSLRSATWKRVLLRANFASSPALPAAARRLSST